MKIGWNYPRWELTKTAAKLQGRPAFNSFLASIATQWLISGRLLPLGNWSKLTSSKNKWPLLATKVRNVRVRVTWKQRCRKA